MTPSFRDLHQPLLRARAAQEGSGLSNTDQLFDLTNIYITVPLKLSAFFFRQPTHALPGLCLVWWCSGDIRISYADSCWFKSHRPPNLKMSALRIPLGLKDLFWLTQPSEQDTVIEGLMRKVHKKRHLLFDS